MMRGFDHWYAYGNPVCSGVVATFLWLRPILYFALFILAVYIIYRLFFKDRTVFKKQPKALEILQERFAKGEITEEEYIKVKSILEEQRK